MEKVERFIEKFIPENYNLFLDINRKDKKFEGCVVIKGEALNENICLHQKDLEIKSIKLNNNDLNFTVDNEIDKISINSNKLGEIELKVCFAGNITDNMVGMYPSYYTENGVKKEVISTQLASHFARQVFPSVDEPEAKATFDLSIKFDTLYEDEIVISNMPEINVENRKKSDIWKFDTTPKMSTYLLAFAIGSLQSKIAKTKNGTEVGIFSTKAHTLKSLDFALDIALRSIEFYEDYFGVKYPIPQSYHIALPDFSAGAMENWGLVTYREVYLLVDDNSTVSSRQQVALVVAHELAHQWFGNLVTMKWWDDLWLNESFANMMEYVTIDRIEPTWNIIEDFQSGGVDAALKRDATDGVQAVHVDVSHPDEINSLFDPAIVYAKGSRLLHMLHRWIGDENFAKGLSSYFEKFSYGNTIGSDLWGELNKVSGKDVASFMKSWLDEPGYPVVNVKVENDTLIISQKQFFIGKNEDKNRLWHVPLNSNWQGLPDILTTEKLEIANFSKLQAENNGALRLNTENTAHYIVQYENELLTNLLNEFSNLDKISKLQVLKDLRLLAEGEIISVDKLVELLPLLTNEDSYLVISEITKIIASIKRFIESGSYTEKKFKEIVKTIFKNNFERLGFEKKDNEIDNDEFVRQLTLSSMLYADDEKAINESSKIFKNYKDNLENIPAQIRFVVLYNEIKHNESEELVNTYFELYKTTNDSNFRNQISQALSETKNEKTLEKVINSLKDKDIIKPQDLAMGWYAPFLAKDFSQNNLWDWACSNWDWIMKALGGDMSFDRFVIYPAMFFKSKEKLEEYKEFFNQHLNNVAISRSIKMGINEIEARVSLIETQKENIEIAINKIEL